MSPFLLPLLLAAGCADAPPLPVLYAGCAEVVGGCELTPDEPLRVWVAAPPTSVRAPDGATVESAAGGARVVLVAPSPGPFVVRANGAVATLQLIRRPERPWEQELRAMTPDACRAAADARLPGITDPTERATTLWVAAGCDLRAGAREAGVTRMEAAAVAFDAAGRPFDAARARCALSSVMFGAEGSLPRVRAHLDAVPTASENGALVWGAAWHRALLHRRTGNYRAATVALDAAESAAERVGLVAERDAAREQRAVLAAELGRPRDAAAAQRLLVDTTPITGECASDAGAAARRTALSWFLLLDAYGSQVPPATEVDALLDAAADVHARCGHPARERANVEVNRALGALLRGDPSASRTHLAAAAAAQPGGDPLYNAWVAEIDGRLLLASGDPTAAAAAFDRALAFARLRGGPEAEAQALDGRAAARWAAGRREEAVADWAAAQSAVWSGVGLVPFDAGAAAFLSARDGIPARQVQALLALDRPEEAFAVARAARAYLLRANNVRARLEALDPAAQRRWDDAVARYRGLRAELETASRDAWRLSVAELEGRRTANEAGERAARGALDDAMAALGGTVAGVPPPPAPGDVLLLWVPVPEGWVGFAADPHGVQVARFAADADLLAPFADTIGAARRVVLLPWGSLRERDLHTLPFDGAPLLAARAVVWSLDLGPAPPRLGDRRLLVADPTGDLPGARAEAAVVRAAWAEADELVGGSARVDAVRAALAEADSFHYAGHATTRDGDVWEAGLSLADGVFRVGDVLALPRVPASVVLSACASGRGESGAVEGWGLAQAFVARGASVVVATSRPVSDRAAERLAGTLYDAGSADLVEATRTAQLALRAAGDADWAAFRVWVP